MSGHIPHIPCAKAGCSFPRNVARSRALSRVLTRANRGDRQKFHISPRRKWATWNAAYANRRGFIVSERDSRPLRWHLAIDRRRSLQPHTTVDAFRCAGTDAALSLPPPLATPRRILHTLYPHSHPKYCLPEFREMFGARQFYSAIRSTSLQHHRKCLRAGVACDDALLALHDPIRPPASPFPWAVFDDLATSRFIIIALLGRYCL